jgi:hypothetical protein
VVLGGVILSTPTVGQDEIEVLSRRRGERRAPAHRSLGALS